MEKSIIIMNILNINHKLITQKNYLPNALTKNIQYLIKNNNILKNTKSCDTQ